MHLQKSPLVKKTGVERKKEEKENQNTKRKLRE